MAGDERGETLYVEYDGHGWRVKTTCRKCNIPFERRMDDLVISYIAAHLFTSAQSNPGKKRPVIAISPDRKLHIGFVEGPS